MNEWVQALTGMEWVFFVSALVGGLFLMIWIVLQFVGGGDDLDFDTDVDVDVDVDASPDVSGEADVSFKLLSFQGISAFFTMFGLVGLAIIQEGGGSSLAATAGGVATGGLAMFVIAKLFAFFRGLQSSGTVNMNDAVGQEGSVYLGIPAGGEGKVQITVNNHLKVLDATTDAAEKIETGQRIRVTRVVDGQTLVVEPLPSTPTPK